MDRLRNGWFSEINDLWKGRALSIEVTKVLHAEKSKYQDILVLDTESFGKVLVLDGIIQCTEKDEFAYQEMISFLPLCCHKNPERVLIIGGGDGGVAREVAKHPSVKEIYQVEIDERVIEVSKRFLPFMAEGFADPKLRLRVEDGFEFMRNHRNEFDVIITDSSDPVGPGVQLFEENYYSLMKNALRDDGIICSQGGTVWTEMEQAKSTLNHCRNLFSKCAFAVATVPSYPTGQIGFIMGSLNKDQRFSEPERAFTDIELDKMNMRYYSSDIHRMAFVLPRFVNKELGLQ